MSRLTLRLPETLHQQLARLAEGEGVSLNQYIVYALTRQATSAYSVRSVPDDEVNRQEEKFQTLVNKLKPGTSSRLMAVLSQREMVKPEESLTPEVINQMEKLIQKAAES